MVFLTSALHLNLKNSLQNRSRQYVAASVMLGGLKVWKYSQKLTYELLIKDGKNMLITPSERLVLFLSLAPLFNPK
jgi:hypothetical protein